jgi:ABC-type branched-subunit amino acid transport system substrate-binding protein
MRLLSLRIPFFVAVCAAALVARAADDIVRLGLDYDKTGPYARQGLDQLRCAELAVEEVNAAGGILGRKVELVARDCQSSVPVAKINVLQMIANEHVAMIFGGVASSVAVETGKICEAKGVPFFGTLTYATTTTCEDGHRHTFRECYDSWAAAKVLAQYMKEHYAGKKFFYVTANYNWGKTTEAAFRKFTGTEDETIHKRIITPFPSATEDDFKAAITAAARSDCDVLVVVEFGHDMVEALRQATQSDLKAKKPIIVPNLTLTMAEAAGPEVMEGVVGALPWDWTVPAKYHYARGQAFVDAYEKKFNRYPCTSGASAYAIVYEYKAAVERAKTFDPAAVIKALEGHKYTILKDEQEWRDFDHQSIQTVYAVKCRPVDEVLKSKYQLDYFEIIGSLSGDTAFRTRDEWNARRKAASLPTELEALN